ncbi:MAG: T9SS type A sorting domain-containing protein, partial [Candidatus Amulumruptor sp.]
LVGSDMCKRDRVNPDMRVEMTVDAEEPVEVDLHEAIDDMDGANKFIRFSLVNEAQAAADEDSSEPVAAEIKDGKLLLTPQKIGDTTVKLTAESNGREALISIPVYVADKGSSIGDTAIDMDGKMFDLQGNVLTLSGYEGVTVGIYDINGRQMIRFTPDSSYFSIALDLAKGVYAMGADGGHRFKFMVK